MFISVKSGYNSIHFNIVILQGCIIRLLTLDALQSTENVVSLESAYIVPLLSIISDDICGLYLSTLSRRHFPYIEAHRE